MKAISRTGDDRPASGAFDSRDKENVMICLTILKYRLSWLHVRAFGLLLSLASLPVFGQQIHQLSYDGSKWADQNLNGAPVERPMTSFFTTPNDQFHVFYGAAESGELNQLFYNGSDWADLDLTQSAGVNQAFGISGFSVANLQYVFYVGNDDDLHQMFYNNAGWVDTDLTIASGGNSIPESNVVAFTTSPALHVYYTANDNHIHQVFATNGTNWQDQDLTAAVGGPFACQCDNMTGFNIGNYQYVYYTELDNNHIHQLSYNNISWSDEDLTALTKSSPASIGLANLSALVIPGTNKMRVYFVSGRNSHVIQLASTNNGKWSSSDLTKRAKSSGADGQIVAIPDANDGKVNVYYVEGHDLIRIYQPTKTTWAFEDLTFLTNGGAADYLFPLSGFALNNNLYLYYVVD
jgi:hypothetical protein